MYGLEKVEFMFIYGSASSVSTKQARMGKQQNVKNDGSRSQTGRALLNTCVALLR